MTIHELSAQAAICAASDALDRERYDEFIALCAPNFRYRIVAFSPDIRREMVFLQQDRTELKNLLSNLGEHVRMPGALLRHLGCSSVRPSENEGELETVSPFAVYYTELNGQTRLFAVGKYEDRWVARDGSLLLAQRDVRLDTRALSPGCHVPL